MHTYSTEATYKLESVEVPWLEAPMRLHSGIYSNVSRPKNGYRLIFFQQNSKRSVQQTTKKHNQHTHS